MLSDFSGESWTEITEMENLGSVGGEWELVDQTRQDERNPAAAIFEDQIKGVRKATRMQLAIGHQSSDAGQAALVAAFMSESAYPIRLTFSDAPAGGTPSQRHFFAIVVTLTDLLDGANRVVGMSSDLVLKSSVVRTLAAEGD